MVTAISEKITKAINLLLKQKQNIKNRMGFLRDVLKNPDKYESVQEYTHKDGFTNYPQRDYDFDKLEKQLLGWD